MASRRGPRLEDTLRNEDKLLRKELLLMTADTAQTVADALSVVVKGWKNKPTFKPEVQFSAGNRILVGTIRIGGPVKARNIFRWVDKGTGKFGPKKQPYLIIAKNAPALVFQTEYQPKTLPIAKVNVGPGKATGKWVKALVVHHPGIEGREFASTIAEALHPPFTERVKSAWKRAVRRF